MSHDHFLDIGRYRARCRTTTSSLSVVIELDHARPLPRYRSLSSLITHDHFLDIVCHQKVTLSGTVSSALNCPSAVPDLLMTPTKNQGLRTVPRKSVSNAACVLGTQFWFLS